MTQHPTPPLTRTGLALIGKRITAGLTALMLLVYLGTPSMAAAATTPSTSAGVQGCGLNKPTGDDSVTYTYNAKTGLWQNAHYTWSAQTCKTTPIDPVTYTYNYTTGRWDATVWSYDPAAKQFNQVRTSVATPPSGPNYILVKPAPPVMAPTPSLISPTTGSNSTNNTDSTITNNANTTNTSQATVNNQINSTGQSGNTAVVSNTAGGSATSGDAVTTADILNALQSNSSLTVAANPPITFVDNVNGTVNGNLLVDPSSIVQPASGSNQLLTTNNVNTTDNNTAQINNNVTLGAASGNAKVANNSSAGNATSGNADAVANVVNMINSMIASKQSFIGVINILGDLNGNILLPSQFYDSLIASNAPSSTITITNNSSSNNLATTLNNNQAVNNVVTTTAATGLASATNNTKAGNATSGQATTNVTVFNLTGDQVVSNNTLLVFVNVLGKWVGMLLNAPAGSTAAAFAGGVTTNSTAQSNNVNTQATNQASINNKINVNAQSGDAAVSGNTSAGNATSGNANAAANLLNINNSSFATANWFGILFINVFGDWTGNFGIQSPLAPNQKQPPTLPSPSSAKPQNNSSPLAKFNSLVHAVTGQAPVNAGGTSSTINGQSVNLANAVLAASTTTKPYITVTQADAAKSRAQASSDRYASLRIGLIITAGGLLLFAIERTISIKNSRRIAAQKGTSKIR